MLVLKRKSAHFIFIGRFLRLYIYFDAENTYVLFIPLRNLDLKLIFSHTLL